jgi:hypothetical protein
MKWFSARWVKAPWSILKCFINVKMFEGVVELLWNTCTCMARTSLFCTIHYVWQLYLSSFLASHFSLLWGHAIAINWIMFYCHQVFLNAELTQGTWTEELSTSSTHSASSSSGKIPSFYLRRNQFVQFEKCTETVDCCIQLLNL